MIATFENKKDGVKMVNIHGKRIAMMTYVLPGFAKELEEMARKELAGVQQWKAPTLRIALEEYVLKRKMAAGKPVKVPPSMA